MRNDHLHAVGAAAEVGSEHQHVRSAACQVFCRGDLSVAQKLDVGTATLKTSLESHFVLHNQILFRHIDRLVEKCRNSVVGCGVLRDQRLVTVQSWADKAVTPDPGLRRIFVVVTVQPSAIITLEGFQEFQLTIDLRNDIFLLALIGVFLRRSVTANVHQKLIPAKADAECFVQHSLRYLVARKWQLQRIVLELLIKGAFSIGSCGIKKWHSKFRFDLDDSHNRNE